jgi:uncharacterized OsmC-like protein
MTTDELRQLQAPLKARYREEPSSAVVTMRAECEVAAERCAGRVPTHAGPVTAGLHPAAGGDGTLACSGDMLLQALAACAGVTLGAVATATGTRIEAARVDVGGDLDFRGTLGVDREAPVGFREIRLRFSIGSDASSAEIEKLVQLTERYCVVLQTLRKCPTLKVETSVERRA